MDHSRFPTETCEQIIDACYVDDDRSTEDRRVMDPNCYRVWCRTALVCSTWLPRSRLNLLHETILEKASHVDLLLRTLHGAPYLAQLITRLRVVNDDNTYVPFARPPLPRLLKNCVALDLYSSDWTAYPPRYAGTDLIAMSSMGIVELYIALSSATTLSLLRFIPSLVKLRKLSLASSLNEGNHHSPKTWPPRIGRLGAFKPLEKLILYHRSVAINYPPRYFGENVVDLGLYIRYSLDRVSDGILQCIQNFGRLRALQLDFVINKADETYTPQSMSRIRLLFSIMQHIASGTALREIHITVRPFIDQAYFVDRAGLLDLLVGAQMLEILDRFPRLSELEYRLKENDRSHSALWWKGEIVRRLPSRLHSATSARVDWSAYYRRLWLTETQIDTIRARNQQASTIRGSVERNSLVHAPVYQDMEVDHTDS